MRADPHHQHPQRRNRPSRAVRWMIKRYRCQFEENHFGDAGALQISRHSGMSLQSDQLYIVSDGCSYKENEIAVTARIGVDYAAEDALLLYRFIVKGNKYVSGKKFV